MISQNKSKKNREVVHASYFLKQEQKYKPAINESNLFFVWKVAARILLTSFRFENPIATTARATDTQRRKNTGQNRGDKAQYGREDGGDYSSNYPIGDFTIIRVCMRCTFVWIGFGQNKVRRNFLEIEEFNHITESADYAPMITVGCPPT